MPNNTYRLDSHALILLCIVLLTNGDLRCPDISERRLRGNVFCKMLANSSYICLFDENNKHFVEFCIRKPEFLAPGFKYVMRGGFDGKPCGNERFQPYKFWINSGSNCVLQKSKCEEEGQIFHNPGSTRTDASCRCDYGQGYDFVVLPVNRCFCYPSFEDCSCYRKACNENHILSPDYQCIPTNSVQYQIRCSSYTGLPGSYEVEPTTPKLNTERSVQNAVVTGVSDISVRHAIILISVILSIIVTLLVSIVKWDNIKHVSWSSIFAVDRQSRRSECNKESRSDIFDGTDSESNKIIKGLVKNVLSYNVVIVMGESKFGKSLIVKYVALLLYAVHGFETYYCKTPDDIDKSLQNARKNKTLILENYFDSDTKSENILERWAILYEKIRTQVHIGNVKMMITCLPIHVDCRPHYSKFSTETVFDITPLLGDYKPDLLRKNGNSID